MTIAENITAAQKAYDSGNYSNSVYHYRKALAGYDERNSNSELDRLHVVKLKSSLKLSEHMLKECGDRTI